MADPYISLADAWAKFWEHHAPPILQNRLLARPPAPSPSSIKDPETEKSVFLPRKGQDFEEGITPPHVVEMLVAKFRELVVYPLEGVTYCRLEGDNYRNIELRAWWAEIKGQLAEKHTVMLGDWAKDRNEIVNIYDGGPWAWTAYRPRAQFTIDIWFDRVAFEALAIWEKHEARAIAPKRRVGAPKDKRERIKEAMRRDMEAGADLIGMKQEALAARYGCHRKTAIAALDELLIIRRSN